MGFWEELQTLIIANLLHGIVSLIWIAGIRRLVKPLSPDLHAELLQMALVMPVWIGLLRVLRVPFLPPHLSLIRIEEWSGALRSAPFLARAAFFLFLGGVLTLFLAQEFIPLIHMLQRRRLSGERPDARLQNVMARVSEFYRNARIRVSGSQVLRKGFRIPVHTPLAALHGLVSPVLIVSEVLLQRLDDPELEGVVAHEAAHLYYGGNLRMFMTWLARACQAFNPLSLVLFRELIEARELACDSLAARATAQPKILARALMKFSDPPTLPSPTSRTDSNRLKQAKQELRERAEVESTRARFDALQGDAPHGDLTPRPLAWLLALIFGGMLWTIA